VPSTITTSALMALEAWAHREIERGRPFEEVLNDALGPDGSSIAFVAVAVDIILSHWRLARDVAWPIVACPEFLEFDDARLTRDLTGVFRSRAVDREGATWRVKCADLESRLSRRNSLSRKIFGYVFGEKRDQLETLRTALEQATNEIRQKPSEGEDPITGLHATAERALRMTDASHWRRVSVKYEDGTESEGYEFDASPEETALREAAVFRSSANAQQLRIRSEIQEALLDGSKSSAKIVADAITWAKSQPDEAPTDGEIEERDFDKEWHRRAKIMTAALAARDYNEADRAEVLSWAVPVLNAAANEKAREYEGPQIEYNTPAIAGLGLVSLYLKDGDASTRDALLRFAGRQHPAIRNALRRDITALVRFDARVPGSLALVGRTGATSP
jgi:hypothetical protein